jgi:hypothetical protein
MIHRFLDMAGCTAYGEFQIDTYVVLEKSNVAW